MSSSSSQIVPAPEDVDLTDSSSPLEARNKKYLAAKLLIVLSLIYSDMTTDILVWKEFIEMGEYSWANLCLGFFSSSLVVQVLITYVAYRNLPWKKLVLRMLCSLFGLNPLVTSWEVWTGKKETGNMGTMELLSASRLTEVGMESLPESIVQSIFMMQTTYDKITNTQIISVLIGFLSVAYSLASTAIEQELSWQSWKKDGEFDPVAGIIPNIFFGRARAQAGLAMVSGTVDLV